MDADSPGTSFLVLLALILASGFFVAAEFAILACRRRRVDPGEGDGAPRSSFSFWSSQDVEELSLLSQFGGAFTTLLIGYLTAGIAVALVPRLPTAAAVAIGLSLAAAVHVVLSQQIPRFLGTRYPGLVTHPVVLAPLRAAALVLRPLLAVLSATLDALSATLHLSRTAFYAPIHTPEDIRELVTHGHEQGVLEEDEREMIHGVFDFTETVAREVMTPRIDIVAVPRQIALDELLSVVVGEGHSRIPIYDGTIDNVVGVLLTKDLLPVLADTTGVARESFDVGRLMREPFFVPDTKPVDDILSEFRQFGVHLAIVIDEFGGTYGLLTMEDLLEEIVGEIKDEHDVEEPEFSATPEGDFLIDGGASISEVNERFGLEIPEEDFDTVGGYIFGALGRVPVPGDTVQGVGTAGQVLEVEETEDRRVMRVRLRPRSVALAPDT